MKTFKIILSLALSSCLLFASCIDADIDEVVPYDKFYANVDDADAAILGLYGKVMELAAPVVVLNELRGDLLDVTPNASADLQEINLHKPSAGNEWADVTKFYNVIQNCNDILFNFNKMLKENKLTEDEYKERYSDVGAIRCWVYYQLGIQFLEVPYITEPIIDIKDLSKYKDRELKLDKLVDTLIVFMENLPTLENYQNSKLASTGSGNTVDGYYLAPFFINKKCFLGDLYLFDNRYDEAATIYRDVLSAGEDQPAGNRDQNRKYRIRTYVYQSGDPDWFQVLYMRNKGDDVSSLINAWKKMFSLPADDRSTKDEMIWEMSYDYKTAPTYPFIELFANKGKGKYLLKPSKYAVDDFWGGEVQSNGFPFDARGLTGGIEETSPNEYVVAKYLYDYDSEKQFEQKGKWFLYRAGLLHLRYAEAANRAGYPKLAWTLVNCGLSNSAENGNPFDWRKEDGSTYRGDSIKQSGWAPGVYYPAPYYFDARMDSQPYLRAPWRENGGIRGRANLPNVAIPAGSTLDSIRFIEKMIIKEAGLELGFEGHRWADLIRVSRRMQRETGTGSEFLQDQIRGKYQKAGLSMPNLSTEDDWFFKMNK